MATLDIARLTVAERLDLLGELWDSLTAEDVRLTPAQQRELARRVEDYEASHDDLVWAKPYVDEAIAEIERGEGMSLDALTAHLDARFGKLAD